MVLCLKIWESMWPPVPIRFFFIILANLLEKVALRCARTIRTLTLLDQSFLRIWLRLMKNTSSPHLLRGLVVSPRKPFGFHTASDEAFGVGG
jgi:hypothetical protein